MSDPFVHLHVASGYSLRYGASSPAALVERAAEHGMDTLGLTDRDGLYGAVRFTKACLAAGVRPVLGVDLATNGLLGPGAGVGSAGIGSAGVGPAVRAGVGAGVRPGSVGRGPGGSGVWAAGRGGGSSPRVAGPGTAGTGSVAAGAGREPARGGRDRDPRRPRVVLIALDGGGWSALCRLVTEAHLSGDRGDPVVTIDQVARHAAGGGLLLLLGPGSEAVAALARNRVDLADAVLARWRAAVPPENLAVEVVSHRGRVPGAEITDTVLAARTLRWARGHRLTAVLGNAVRYVDRGDAPVVDVLDAVRRLVPIDLRHVDRRTSEGYLKSGKEMAAVAEEIAVAAGEGDSGARRLLADTRRVAERCAVDPRRDLGLGAVFFPELQVSAPPARLGLPPDASADVVLRSLCEAGVGRRGMTLDTRVRERLEHELGIIGGLGYAPYFLAVADVVSMIREMGVRCAARGSGAGSLVTYLTGVSDVDPLRHDLLMERFLSPLRTALPDLDLDVESARRTEIYEAIFSRYGAERVTCVAMMETYRVRHAIRDVGAALGLPPGEIGAIATSFPHIRARDARNALRELPELRASGLGESRLDLLFRLVERLDGLPRHVALHPCGVILSDGRLLDRTPVESSYLGFPMSQFDKDDVEDIGLLKLDVLGIRMQSAMAHAVQEIRRVDGVDVDLAAVPFDDRPTFDLIRSTRTLGCFQIESPGQRELVGKFAPESFEDLIIDISLFRPGPVKSDMITPFLDSRAGWRLPDVIHEDLRPYLSSTWGVVVFHEQVLQILATMTGCSLAQADETRRALGDPAQRDDLRVQFCSDALGRGYPLATVTRVWDVLAAFGSFGFCKAHAAAFALPTYQSAWLKAHHTAAFVAGVLTHDPGMYPKRVILDDARHFGVEVLPLDVNRSDAVYRVEQVQVEAPLDLDLDPGSDGTATPDRPADPDGAVAEPVLAGAAAPGQAVTEAPGREAAWGPGREAAEVRGPGAQGSGAQGSEMQLPDARGYGIRLALSDVKGISDAEVARIVAGRPYHSLADFWNRAGVSRPVVENLVLTGALDSVYGIGRPAAVRRRQQVTRRDLLLQVGELDRWTRAVARGAGGSRRRRAPGAVVTPAGPAPTSAGAAGAPLGHGSAADDRSAGLAAAVVAAASPGVSVGSTAQVETGLGTVAPGPVQGAAASGTSGSVDRWVTQDAAGPDSAGLGTDPGSVQGPVGSGPVSSSVAQGAVAGSMDSGTARSSPVPGSAGPGTASFGAGGPALRIRERAAGQAVVTPAARSGPVSAGPVQLALDLGDEPGEVRPTGLPEMTGAERTRAELALLGLDASRHVVDFYVPFMTALGATRADRLRECRSRAEVFVAGVKVATQTPPVRSGRRVVFVTLDDATGPIDATFFEDAQGSYAETLFHSWLLVIRGIVRRTGPQGLSIRGTGAWDLTTLHDAWVQGGPSAVADLMADPEPAAEEGADARGVRDVDRAGETPQRWDTPERPPTAGGMGPRRVLVHPSGFRQSPYADIAPAGDSPRDAARRAAENADRRPGRGADQGTPALRKLWHSSPGSPGR